MQQCNDSEVHVLVSKVHPNVKVKEDRSDYDLYQKNKVRLIDPPLLREGEVIHSSVVSENIRKMSEVAYEKSGERDVCESDFGLTERRYHHIR